VLSVVIQFPQGPDFSPGRFVTAEAEWPIKSDAPGARPPYVLANRLKIPFYQRKA
jgi:hypothetical protein